MTRCPSQWRALRKRSAYGIQLVEQQKVKALYGVLERQLRRHIEEK